MGLVALDIVFAADAKTPPRCYAGGTCGNVLTVLSYLGWSAIPISRLGRDVAAERLVEDLRRWKVSTELVTRKTSGSTPVVVERIRIAASGAPVHSFSWRCPSCGSHLPGYKPVLASAVEQLSPTVVQSQVFFFDRASRATISLAQVSRKRGAVVVFEPSGTGDPKLFREAWRVAHIVKYAQERLRDLGELNLPKSDRKDVLLEIETAGEDGLRFRSWLPQATTSSWQIVRALKPLRVKDTAGAGDWCTAGILQMLARDGVAGLKRSSLSELRSGLLYGQALAAWNCGFEGARGGMYEASPDRFAGEVQQILKGRSSLNGEHEHSTHRAHNSFVQLCRTCKGTTTRRFTTASMTQKPATRRQASDPPLKRHARD